ncbi:unannotated protein [freshwater metagenome]|uniref:Unannotated protein n=1 Tax=freshwater metagenome TaxID=449393 RepID=A0A6J7DMK3_9ZZZZ
MGDRDDGARVLGEMALKPADRLGVEVVRRLVEQQQVRSAQQQTAERNAAALAAGELGDVRVGRRQAQRVHRVLELRVETPRVRGIDLRLEVGKLVGGLVGVVRGELVEAVKQRLRLSDAVLDVALHVLGLVENRLLLEQADRRAGGQLRLATVVLVDPRHDPQDARLAGAVVAQHPDLRAWVEGQRDVLEHGLVGRVGLRELVHREDVLGSHGGDARADGREPAAR